MRKFTPIAFALISGLNFGTAMDAYTPTRFIGMGALFLFLSISSQHWLRTK